VRRLLKPFIEAVFRVLFTYECTGQEQVPVRGPAVVAANHPSYMDPVLLSLRVRRPIRFMAWEALFRVPVLSTLLRAFGSFPVDVRRGHGREAYDKAKAMLRAGKVVGIFPEGKRSRTGWMEPNLREGAARLALETGAPLVPATIAGAHRAWPHYQSLPRPARIRVRFHDAIDPAEYRSMEEEAALEALLGELRQRVDRSLMPGVKRDLKIRVLYRTPAPWPRLYETVPPLALALFVFWLTGEKLPMVPAYAYIAYLLADHFVIPQRRPIKWLRNASPAIFLLAWGPTVMAIAGRPEIPAQTALAALLAGAGFPYLYERGRTSLAFIRGMVFACVLELGAQYLSPTPLGPHLALPIYAAAFAWQRRTVFWPYTAPLLVAYAFGIAYNLFGGLELSAHILAGLLAWLGTQMFHIGTSDDSTEAEAEPHLSLNL
jgi:1-acyl-sn-glycerol-3-phosphate acyltransferase